MSGFTVLCKSFEPPLIFYIERKMGNIYSNLLQHVQIYMDIDNNVHYSASVLESLAPRK